MIGQNFLGWADSFLPSTCGARRAVSPSGLAPLAAQLAMWLAFIRTGVLAATLVSLAFILPSFFMVLAMALIYAGAGGAA